MKLRTDEELSVCMKSRAVEDDPIHTIPHTSKNDSRRVGDRSDELDPTRTESLIDSEESSFKIPTTSSEDSIRKRSAITTKTQNARNPRLPKTIHRKVARMPNMTILHEGNCARTYLNQVSKTKKMRH